MILGFYEYFDKKKTQPTWFREKILLGGGQMVILPEHHIVHDKNKPGYISHISKVPVDINAKLHTLRLDPYDRWRAGMSIQMVYRGPKYSIKDHFNKGIPELEKCKSTQNVEIKWYKDKSEIGEIATMIGIKHKDVKVSFDGKECIHVAFSDGGLSCAGVGYDRLVHGNFSQNDGFHDVYGFFKWFNKDFSGKIIHWSDLRY